MLHRVRRIVPLYWIVTVIMAACAYVKPQFFYGVTVGPWEMLTSLLFIPHANAMGDVWPIVLQGWTLNIEMLFYLIFALTVCARPLLRLGMPTALLIALPLVGAIFHPASAVAILWTSPLLIELLMGLWVGYAYTSAWLRYHGVGLALIVASVVSFAQSQGAGEPATNTRFLVYGIPAMALVTGFLMVETAKPIPTIRSLLFLGDASYSIYLWHGVATVILGALLLRLHVQEGLLAGAILVAGALATSLVGYVLVERPITRALARKKSAGS